MAFTIELGIENDRSPSRIVTELKRKLVKSRFRLNYEPMVESTRQFQRIFIKGVRLKEAKPYCGQHPGECFLNRPLRKSTCLEWDDWIEFNNLVNDVLDGMDNVPVAADVYSTPMELLDKELKKGRRFFIRQGVRRRVKYDYREEDRGASAPIRYWNPGTDDQFVEEKRG